MLGATYEPNCMYVDTDAIFSLYRFEIKQSVTELQNFIFPPQTFKGFNKATALLFQKQQSFLGPFKIGQLNSQVYF